MAQIARAAVRGHQRKRRAGGSLALTVAASTAAIVAALVFVSYVLWPRPLATLAPDAPSVPIIVAGVAFNVPPAAIRVPQQRRAGTQERLDLAFMWPSLTPPDPAAKPAPSDEPKPLDRLFMTIAGSEGALAPAERLKSIYPRFVTPDLVPGPGGLVARRFTDGSPYQGEDLLYDPAAPEAFAVRCSRPGAGGTPGICLLERRIGAAEIIARFPRDWLADWQSVGRGVDKLIASLRPQTR